MESILYVVLRFMALNFSVAEIEGSEKSRSILNCVTLPIDL